ncbi:MAG: HEAT repeat domain-containing protein, partial [Spirochaetota bacterium]
MKYLSLIGILALLLVPLGNGVRLSAQEDKSTVEERKGTLRFGITSEILSVLETITEEKETGYTEEAESLFDTLRDPGVHAAVFHYFRAIDDDSLVERAAEVLTNHLDKPQPLVASVIRYAAETGIEELEPRIFVIAESGLSGTLSLDAVKALGELGDEETVTRLLELYDKSGVSEQVREQIILVLGKLQAEQAVDLLIDIARDQGESLTMRRFAADSLGRIGSPRAADTLEELYLQDDPYLRANAVYSLGLIGGPAAEAILFAALRDEFWRIRVSAAEAIGEAGIKEGIDILTYKAQNDPEIQVRTAAVEALGKIGGGKSFDFLK